jgi:hypothetical protein
VFVGCSFGDLSGDSKEAPKLRAIAPSRRRRVIAKPARGPSRNLQVHPSLSLPPTTRRPLFLFLYFSTKPHPFSHQTNLGQVRAALRESASRIIVLPVDCRAIVEKLDATFPRFQRTAFGINPLRAHHPIPSWDMQVTTWHYI